MNYIKGWIKTLRLRYHFAYRNSFRSGLGFMDFLDCWKFSGQIYDKPQHADYYWGE